MQNTIKNLGILMIHEKKSSEKSISRTGKNNTSLMKPKWQKLASLALVRVFSDVLVAFIYFDICHYRQSKLAIENPEFCWAFSMKNMVIK